jgi:hypothetical protein
VAGFIPACFCDDIRLTSGPYVGRRFIFSPSVPAVRRGPNADSFGMIWQPRRQRFLFMNGTKNTGWIPVTLFLWLKKMKIL